jgi:hypothetical protein
MSVIAASFNMALAMRARHPAAKMGAVNTSKPDVVLKLELPGQRSVVGPGAMKLAIVVSVPGNGAPVHDRPVGHILEQKVRVVLQIGWRNERSGQTETVRVGAHAIPALYGIPAAKGDEATTVDHLAANIKIRIHNQHGCSEIARPDRGVKSCAPRSADNNICFVVPRNVLS